MQLTKAFEQGVCVMTMLTMQNPEIPLGSGSIHRNLGTSATYIQKIVRKLVVYGIVTSVSGQRGGFKLARPSDEITYLDVVEAIEGPVETFPNTNLIARVLGNVIDVDKIDRADYALHKTFEEADRKWRDYLSSFTIQDLVNDVLGEQEFQSIDWNDISSASAPLKRVRKLIKGEE